MEQATARQGEEVSGSVRWLVGSSHVGQVSVLYTSKQSRQLLSDLLSTPHSLLSRLDHRLDVRRAARSYESTKAKGSVEEHVNVSLNSAERVLRAGVAAYHKYLVYTQLPFLNMSIMDSLVIVSYAACMFGILFGDGEIRLMRIDVSTRSVR